MDNTTSSQAKTETVHTIVTFAEECMQYFENKTRADSTRYWCTTEDAPEWLEDAIRKVHGDFLPDDRKYEYITDALEIISGEDNDATEEELQDLKYEIEPDIYYTDILQWLASNTNRMEYVNEALDEHREGDISEIIQRGQVKEKQEVYQSILQSLVDHLETLDQ